MCELCNDFGLLDCDKCGVSTPEAVDLPPNSTCLDPACDGSLVDNCNAADFEDEDTDSEDEDTDE